MSSNAEQIQHTTAHLSLLPSHAVLSASIGSRTKIAARAVGRAESTVYAWQEARERSDLERTVALCQGLEDDGQDPELAWLPGLWVGAVAAQRAMAAHREHATSLHAVADYSQASGTYGAVAALAMADDVVTGNEWNHAVSAAIEETRAQLASLNRLRRMRVGVAS